MTKPNFDWTKPFETQEGYPAKVISDDCMYKGAPYRVVQIEFPSGDSRLHMYRDDGTLYYGTGRLRNKRVKHEAWQNIYRDHKGVYSGTQFYKSEELARKQVSDNPNYVTTAKIEWEE